jgi:hypothetical protein
LIRLRAWKFCAAFSQLMVGPSNGPVADWADEEARGLGKVYSVHPLTRARSTWTRRAAQRPRGNWPRRCNQGMESISEK